MSMTNNIPDVCAYASIRVFNGKRSLSPERAAKLKVRYWPTPSGGSSMTVTDEEVEAATEAACRDEFVACCFPHCDCADQARRSMKAALESAARVRAGNVQKTEG